MENIDVEKAIKKWSPVLETLKVTGINKIKTISTYAEHHQNIYKKLKQKDNFSELEISAKLSYVPVSLKLFSLLNVENKKIVFLSDPTYEYKKSIQINLNPEIDLNAIKGIDIIQTSEKELLKNVADEINEKLETCDTLAVHVLIDNINLKEMNNNNELQDITTDAKIKSKIYMQFEGNFKIY